jgi:methyl coenzyme M reductase subunit C
VKTLFFEFRLQTGFFETKLFLLQVGAGKMVIAPKNDEAPTIVIPEEEIESITIRNEKSLSIEIQTKSKVYRGTFSPETKYENLLEQLKGNLNKTITCEYERGNKSD